MFQFGQLVPELTTADNVALPLLLSRVRRRAAYKQAVSWLARLGLAGDSRRTGELSGGEAQRVAVARALAIKPKVLFADEPTGSLDSLAGERVMDLLVSLTREEGTTVVLVTHDARVAAYAEREAIVRDGKVTTLTDAEVADNVLARPADVTAGRPGSTDPPPSDHAGGGIGAALLLCVLADFHAFQASSNRQCWECTDHGAERPTPSKVPPVTPRAELWKYSADYYQGQTIERLDLAALGPGAPVPPGVSGCPAPASTTPPPRWPRCCAPCPGRVGARFPGTLAGTIGDKALTGPDELVVLSATSPRSVAGTGARGHSIATAPGSRSALSTSGTPSRSACSRCCSRSSSWNYTATAAVRRPPGGAVRRDAAGRGHAAAGRRDRLGRRSAGGAGRTALCIGIFALVQPTLPGASFIGTRYFASTVTPTAAVYAGLLVAVPVVVAVAQLLALRRVQVSLLGVSRFDVAARAQPLAAGAAAGRHFPVRGRAGRHDVQEHRRGRLSWPARHHDRPGRGRALG